MSEPPLSTAEVAQAAPSAVRRVLGLAPISPGAAICAPAATCVCAPADNLALHRLLLGARKGFVLVCDAGSRCDGGYFGELMALDAQNRGLAGLVIDGSIRDAQPLSEIGFPVFHAGTMPLSCRKSHAASVNEEILFGEVAISPGDEIVADRDAVLVVSHRDWPTTEVAAQAVRARENAIRQELANGKRLAELISLPHTQVGSR